MLELMLIISTFDGQPLFLIMMLDASKRRVALILILLHIFFTLCIQIFCFRLLRLSFTALGISLTVYFFTSSVVLIQVYLRSGNSQRLVAEVLPVLKHFRKRLVYLGGKSLF